MLAGDALADDTRRLSGEERGVELRPGAVAGRGADGAGRRWLAAILVGGVLFVAAARVCLAADASDARYQDRHLMAVNATRGRSGRSETPPMIEQVRFNARTLSFENGVTAGPGVGDLEIQFAGPASGASEPLRYRLFGFDRDWRETGEKRTVVYERLPPGRYDLAFEEAGGGGSGGAMAGSLAITVVAAWWETSWFRGLVTIFLLGVVFALHKLRVGYLVRHTKKLQGIVTQTKAELTLAAKTAGDAQEALKEQALKDSLTGLWNRREIFSMLEREVCRAERDHYPLTLLMIDLDHFKSINDTHGHMTGDEVLRETAGRLTGAMRPYDFAGRYGGEEFLVVLPSCSQRHGAQRAEDFRQALAERPVPTGVGPLAVTCSVGVAVYDGVMPLEELLHRADAALYHAKRGGRNCVYVAQVKIGPGSESGVAAGSPAGQQRA